MNLALRGLPDVRILRRNVLTTSFDRQQKAERNLPLDGYDVILANPPFSGRLDRDRIVDDVKIGTSTATELLFVKYMMDNLKPAEAAGAQKDSRCGVIVPEGVLFGSTGAHKELRRMLMQNNRVEAVLSLPGGVFQPYSGVKTSVLIFARGGRTERVMFLHADFDGFKLDANHDQPIDADDLPGPDRRLPQPRRAMARLAAARSRRAVDQEMVVRRCRRDRARGLEPVRLALPPRKPRSRRAPRPARTAGRIARRCGRDPGRCRGARRRAWGAGGVNARCMSIRRYLSKWNGFASKRESFNDDVSVYVRYSGFR